MTTYYVDVTEVYTTQYVVEADNVDEAIDKAEGMNIGGIEGINSWCDDRESVAYLKEGGRGT